MRTVKTILSLRRIIQKAKTKKKTIGFVPTMGALHEGHLSLIRKSKKENDLTVLSIFVNPAQFGPKEDFKNYPRETGKDILLAKKENVDILFCPSVDEIYPRGYLTYIEVEKISGALCGKYRPGHFKGAATVVGKFLNIVDPDVLYLGQKDAQQAAVLKKMVEDINFPVTIKVCPTVREADGLALSSRNSYLTEEERKEAPVLYRSLVEIKKRVAEGECNSKNIISFIREKIEENSSGKVQYIECVQAESFKPVEKLEGKVLIALAVFFGQTRLIDNILVNVK